MKKGTIFSVALPLLSCIVYTVNAFTIVPPAVTNRHLRRSTRLGIDTSRMSIEELRRIATSKGYDTVGMDRTGLEMIARGWASIVKTRPSRDGPVYDDRILDVTDVEYSDMSSNQPNRVNGPRNPGSRQEYQQSQGQNYQPNNQIDYSSQGSYSSGMSPGWVDTQQRQQPQPQSRPQPRPQPQPQRSPQTQRPPQPQQYQQQPQQQYQQPPPQRQPQKQQPPPRQQPQQSQGNFPFTTKRGPTSNPMNRNNNPMKMNNNDYNQYGGGNRNGKIPYQDSLRAYAAGFFGGGFAVTPVTYLHNIKFPSEIIVNQMSQWEFDTFTGAVSAGAFAIVYRYFVKEQKDDALANGVVAAFILAKSFGRVRVSYYCEGLYCGEPLGFLDWSMFQQAALSGIENLALFGAAALVVEYFCDRGYIDRAGDRY